MNPSIASRRCVSILLLVVLTGRLRLAAEEKIPRLAEIVANADVTAEGRLVPTPTPARPAYYVPVIDGWHEEGRIVAGEEPPKRAEVLRLVGQALAKEGYILQALRPDANTTTPSLIIRVEWGYLNPVITNEGALNLTTGDGGTMAVPGMRDDPTQRESTNFNEREMVALVAGSAIKREAFFSEADWQKVNNAIAEGRYYLMVSAYDFAASLKGDQVLLWRTRMSTPRQGVWMRDVVPALVSAGTPLFGRQTDVPTWQDFRVREGRVELGDLKVIETDVKPAPPESQDAAVSPAELKPAAEKKP